MITVIYSIFSVIFYTSFSNDASHIVMSVQCQHNHDLSVVQIYIFIYLFSLSLCSEPLYHY